VVFFLAHDAPVAGLFIGLTCIYVSDFFASLFAAPAAAEAAAAPDGRVLQPAGPRGNPGNPGNPAAARMGERALGFFHLGTGLWLMYLTWATVLNIANGYHLPL
jgi:hypothetical protein